VRTVLGSVRTADEVGRVAVTERIGPFGEVTERVLAIDGLHELLYRHTRQTAPFSGPPPVETVVVQAYEPALRDERFALRPGEQVTTTAKGQITYSPATAGTSGPIDRRWTMTYVGQEQVTVPAGTFTACRFDRDEGGGSLTTEWFAKGSGVRVKRREQASATIGEDLRRGLLNGVPL
jgi:hypothetical protein